MTRDESQETLYPIFLGFGACNQVFSIDFRDWILSVIVMTFNTGQSE